MNCDLAAETILDIARGIGLDSDLRAAVILHTTQCAVCAARLAEESALTQQLRALARTSASSGSSDGVEGAVLTAFRTNRIRQPAGQRHMRSLQWAGLAIAAGIALAALWQPVTTVHTPVRRVDPIALRPVSPKTASVALDVPVSRKTKQRRIAPRRTGTGVPASRLAYGPAPRETFATEFFALPHAPAFGPEDGVQLVRVRLPRSSLRSFGLLMDETRTAGRVQADVLLGQDGIARAIRFVQ